MMLFLFYCVLNMRSHIIFPLKVKFYIALINLNMGFLRLYFEGVIVFKDYKLDTFSVVVSQ